MVCGAKCIGCACDPCEYTYQRGNGNLDCGEGFVKGFAGEELILTPFVLSAVYLAQKNKMLPEGWQEALDKSTGRDKRR